jgi:hypothetical protein
MAKESTALATKEEANFLIMENPGGAIEALKANLEGEQLSPMDLDTVTVPAGGVTQWTIPGLDKDEHSDAIVGVIIALQNCRAYWDHEYGDGDSVPNCVSEDGRVGVGNPGGNCSVCPFSGGNGCRERKRLFVLRPEMAIPLMVSLPYKSIGPAQKYLLRLGSFSLKYQGVVTQIILEKDKNKDGKPYSKAKFSMVGKLAPAQAKAMEDYAKGLGPLLRRPVTADDYQPVGEE